MYIKNWAAVFATLLMAPAFQVVKRIDLRHCLSLWPIFEQIFHRCSYNTR